MNVTMTRTDGSKYITEAQDMPPTVANMSNGWTGSCHPVALRQSIQRAENPAPIGRLVALGIIAVVVVVVGVGMVWR